MKLDIFNNLKNDQKENNLVENFIQELSKHLEKTKDTTDKNLEQQEEIKPKETQEKNREEDCLYQVVDFSAKGVYLLNKNNNKIFEETEISQELKNQIQNDSILRYKNGEYIYEEELTEEFFNNLEDID